MKSMRDIYKKSRLFILPLLLVINLSACAIAQNVRLTEVYKEKPTSADAMYYYSMGILLKLNGRTDEAIVAMEKAIAADPASAHLVIELISLYSEKGDFKRALALGEKELQRSAGNVPGRCIHPACQPGRRARIGIPGWL